MHQGLDLTPTTDSALAAWLSILNEAIDWHAAGQPERSDVALGWLEDRCEEAYRERERRQAVVS
jgi:hypothetical protein